MPDRLTAEREAEIRGWLTTSRDHGLRSGTWTIPQELLAELDAVRAERDAIQAEMDRLSSPGGQSLPDYWTAEKQLPFVATALNKARARADRAEATLAAIRAWATSEILPAKTVIRLRQELLALLDAAPKETP